MTEMVNGAGQSPNNFAPETPVTPSSTPSQAPADERTFKQSEVNDLIGRAKNEAVERYRRETSMASHQQPQQQAPQYQAPVQQPQYNGMSEQEYRRITAEEIQRSREEWSQEAQRNQEEQNAHRIASEFFTKVSTGDGGRDGFEKLLSESGLDLRSIPYHVQLSNMVDNTREVMEDLARNPTKIGTIQNLIDIDLRAGRQPNLALAEIKRLSQSIKDNVQGSRYKSPNDPLTQLRPSTAGTDKMGVRSAGDYKRDPKYRV
jgi:hypothetical protein